MTQNSNLGRVKNIFEATKEMRDKYLIYVNKNHLQTVFICDEDIGSTNLVIPYAL